MIEHKTINILDISYYLACPPVSGGSLRMLSPLIHMDKTSGICLDFIFSTWSKGYGRECETYLKQNIPIIRNAVGVVTNHYNDVEEGCPENFSVDVWKTMSLELKKCVLEFVKTNDYDIIQIEHSQLSWIVPFIRNINPNVHIVLDCHNVEYLIYERWMQYVSESDASLIKTKYETLKAWEEKVWGWYDSAFSVSPVEVDILKSNGIKNTFLVPTGGGIDPVKYEPKTENVKKQYDILYIGTMSWFPNVHGLMWFIDNVFPLILEKHPDTMLHIVGSGELKPELLKKSSAHIKIWGQQEDDVRFFHNSKVFIIPLWIGAGARVKLITAWASKIPVVSTTLGAEGIDARNDENIMLADEPEAFADSVLKLLDDESLRKRISDKAFDTLQEKYSIDCCVKTLVESYKAMCFQNSAKDQ